MIPNHKVPLRCQTDRVAALLERLPGLLDRQLRRNADLITFEYFVLAMLSEAPDRTLRMTDLGARPTPRCPGSRTSYTASRTAD